MTRPHQSCPTCRQPVGASARRPMPVFLTVPEVAARLAVSKMTVYRLIEQHVLRAHRFGHSLRVSEAALDSYIAHTNDPYNAAYRIGEQP